MSATLMVPLPDEVLERLRQRARQRGTTPEEVAADDLTRAGQGLASNPLRRLAGSLPLGDGNVAHRVDELLGDALLDELKTPNG